MDFFKLEEKNWQLTEKNSCWCQVRYQCAKNEALLVGSDGEPVTQVGPGPSLALQDVFVLTFRGDAQEEALESFAKHQG